MLDHVCNRHEVQDAKADRRDPTQSKDARSRLETYARRAVTQWRNDVQHALVAQDGLGMGRVTLHTVAPQDKMERVLGFMRSAADHRMLELDDTLSQTIAAVYNRGWVKAYKELGQPFSGTVRPYYAIYQSLIVSERKGIVETSLQRAARVLAESATSGETPTKLFQRMSKKVFTDVALKRLILMTNTMITMAYNAGKIDAYERIGLTEVKVIPETVPNFRFNDAKPLRGVAARPSRQTYVTVLTAGDDRVCNLCEELAGHTYSLAGARTLLPRHPNCRCVVVPATDRRFAAPTKDAWEETKHPREPKGVPVGGEFKGKGAVVKFAKSELWGAQHADSMAITGDSAQRMGIAGYKQSPNAAVVAYGLADKFLKAVYESTGTDEPVYHGFRNSEDIEWKVGDTLKLPLLAATGDDVTAAAYGEDYTQKYKTPTVFEFPVGTKVAGYVRYNKQDAKRIGYAWGEALVAGEFEVTGTRTVDFSDKSFRWVGSKKDSLTYTLVSLKPKGVFNPATGKWEKL